jgi:hypothetical protein
MQNRANENPKKKREQGEGLDGQTKFVKFKFNPETEIAEPTPKQPRTALYSPACAGDISGSPATSATSRRVRRVVEEIELYDEDELEWNVAEEPWDWEFCEFQMGYDGMKVAVFEDEQRRPGFFDEGAGPPTVTADEMAWLDQETMQSELDRLRKLNVIDDVDENMEEEIAHVIGA